MGTINQGITGGFSGKVGTVIGGNWKGVDFMRGLPSKMTNPQTEAQQHQRAKVGLMVRFLSPLKTFLRVGFKKQANKMSAFNAATSYNLKHAIIGTDPDYEIDYSKVMVSQGKLPVPVNPEVSYPANGQVVFTWEDNSATIGAMPNDRAVILIYDPDKGESVSVIGGNLRLSGSQVINLPATFEGAEVYCYIAFQNARQTEISDSRYAGGLVL